MLFSVYKKVIQEFGGFETNQKIGFFKGSKEQIINFISKKYYNVNIDNLKFEEVSNYKPEYVEDFSGLKPYIDLTK